MQIKVWVCLLLLLMNCQTKKEWYVQHISESATQTTCMYHLSSDPICGIDIEILQTGKQLITYLQVHSTPLYPSKSDAKQVEVGLSTAAYKKTFLAPLHLGKQRIRLSEEMQTQFLSILKEKDPITLEVSGYRETLDPTQFQKYFLQLTKKAPSFLNKIHIY